MIKSLPKMLAAASLSIAVALTGVMASSTRAEADNENLRRFIVGAAGIAILGSERHQSAAIRGWQGQTAAAACRNIALTGLCRF